jgi:hypothetical protein
MSDYVDLSDMEEDYKKASIYPTVPDNKYKVEVIAARFKYRNDDRLFEWILRDVDTDRKITKTNLIRPDLMHWLKKDLKTCGWEPVSLQEIQQKCAVKLPGLMLEIEVQTKKANGKDFQNVYIQKCLTPPPEDKRAQQEPPPPEDDIPF